MSAEVSDLAARRAAKEAREADPDPGSVIADWPEGHVQRYMVDVEDELVFDIVEAIGRPRLAEDPYGGFNVAVVGTIKKSDPPFGVLEVQADHDNRRVTGVVTNGVAYLFTDSMGVDPEIGTRMAGLTTVSLFMAATAGPWARRHRSGADDTIWGKERGLTPKGVDAFRFAAGATLAACSIGENDYRRYRHPSLQAHVLGFADPMQRVELVRYAGMLRTGVY